MMKKIGYTLLFLLASLSCFAQSQNGIQWDQYYITGSLAINKNARTFANPSAALEIGNDSSRLGILFARGFKDSIRNPVRGLFIYNIPDSNFYYYTGNQWLHALNSTFTIDTNSTYATKYYVNTAHINWSNIVSTPTTVNGYGIIDAVKSVNGQTPTSGAVTITTTNVSEGSNQYFTTPRVQTVIGSDTPNTLLTAYAAGNTYTSQNTFYNGVQKSGTDSANFYNINTQKAVVSDTNNVSEGLLVWWSVDTGEYIARFDSTKWEITPYGQAVAYWTYDGGVTWQPRVYLYSSTTADVRNYGGGIWHGNLYWFFRVYDPVGLTTKRFVGVSTDRGHTFTYTEITGLSGWDNVNMTPFSHLVIGRGDTAMQGFYTTSDFDILQIVNPTTFRVMTNNKIIGVAYGLVEDSWDYMPSTQSYLLHGRNDNGQLPVEQFKGVYSGANISWTDQGATNTSQTGVKGVSPWLYADTTRSSWISVIPQRNVVNTSNSAGVEKDSVLVFINSAASANASATAWVEKGAIQRPLFNSTSALNGYPTGGKNNDSTIKLIFSDKTVPVKTATITGQQNSSWNTPYEFSINYRTSKIANNSKVAQGNQFLNPFTQNYDVRSQTVSGFSYDPIRMETHGVGRSKKYIDYTTDYSDAYGDTYVRDTDNSTRRVPRGANGQFYKQVPYGSAYSTSSWSNIDQLQGRSIDAALPFTNFAYLWNFGGSGDWFPVLMTQWAYSHTEQNTIDTNTVGISTPVLHSNGSAGVLKVQTDLTNGNTDLFIVPNTGGTQGNVRIGTANDVNNTGYLGINVNGTTATIANGVSGSGTALTTTQITQGSNTITQTTNNTTFNKPIVYSGAAAMPNASSFNFLVYNTGNSNAQYATAAQAFTIPTNVATDANYTITSGAQEIELPTITANRNLLFPSPSTYTGTDIRIWNKNTSGTFNWTCTTNAPVLSSGSAFTFTAGTPIAVTFHSDGTVWHLVAQQ